MLGRPDRLSVGAVRVTLVKLDGAGVATEIRIGNPRRDGNRKRNGDDPV
jgi:hypothetical protein